MKKSAQIGIIMGSDSDLAIMKDAGEVLEYFGVPYEILVVSAHRTTKMLYEYALGAQKRGLKAIIAGAGGSAHLPGMTASMTSLPVIGVPVKTKSMDGLDSLLSIVQMPPGVPVATVAINGAKNAGLLAVEMLGISDKNLNSKIKKYKDSMNAEVKSKSKKLKSIGYKKYLNG
jgi:5-(carboxyamino)imidazole ribonucleotide mutase